MELQPAEQDEQVREQHSEQHSEGREPLEQAPSRWQLQRVSKERGQRTEELVPPEELPSH